MNAKRFEWVAALLLAAVAGYGCGDGPGGGSGGGLGGGLGGVGGGGGSGGSGGVPIVLGACCAVDQSCRDSSAGECAARGGEFNDAQLCAELTCPTPDIEALRRAAELLEVATRDEVDVYLDAMNTIGREYWNLNGDEPRYTNELLGRQGAPLEVDGPFNTRTFLARYRVVQQGARLVRAALATDLPITDSEASALLGYAKTFQAYALLLVANQQFSNGILPVDAVDVPNPSSRFLGYAAGLQHIAELLDEGATALTNGGVEFIFSLSAGFDGFRTPAKFRQFNRALSARVRIYLGDKPGAIAGIAGSYFNINGAMDVGPKHAYDVDTRNPMYHRTDEDLYTVHPGVIDDAALGDLRLTQKTHAYVPSPEFFVPVTFEGLAGVRQVQLVEADQDPFPILKNEELILIYAEAQIGSDANEVLAALNRVRNAAGLVNYLGATDDASLLRELLAQRRYGLYGEGHRWVDLRRTGRFEMIPVDRVGDIVHQEFPRPDEATLQMVSEL